MEKYGFVYLWYDKKYKRYYIGCRWGNENDGYICSSSWMKQGYNHRKNDFKRRILSKVYTNKKDLLEEENRWLSKIKKDELGKKYYNLHNYHFNHWSTDENRSLSIKQKVSDTKKKYWNSTESDSNRKLLSELNKSKGIKPPSRTGKIPWNKGLTKDTDSRVQASALAISKPKSNTENMGKYDRSNSNYNIKNGRKI
jgi:hypothetical protein